MRKKHVLIESPTGIGKTHCNLSALLAWAFYMIEKNENCTLIFYCTRTHKQIKNILKEFRKSPYATKAKMTSLGSREHLCPRKKYTKKNGKIVTDKNQICKLCNKKTESSDEENDDPSEQKQTGCSQKNNVIILKYILIVLTGYSDFERIF